MFGEIAPKVKNPFYPGNLTTGSVLFGGNNGVAIQNNSNFFWDNTNDNLYVGGATPSTGLQVAGRLNLYGTDNTIANSQTFYTTGDNYPLMQIAPIQHNNVNLTFDAYYNGSSWVSSYSSSQFQISKSGGELIFNYGTASQGSTVSWTQLLALMPSQVSVQGPPTLTTSLLSVGTLQVPPGTTPGVMLNFGLGNHVLFGPSFAGRNIGVAFGNIFFMTSNLNYNTNASNFLYSSGAAGCIFELTTNGTFAFVTAPAGTLGSAATLTTAVSITNAGVMTCIGNIDVSVAGQGLRVAEGSNAKQGVATLAAGTIAVANTSVTANSRIFLTCQVPGGVPGFLRVSARTAGTSFTILSSNALDTSTVGYEIFEPG